MANTRPLPAVERSIPTEEKLNTVPAALRKDYPPKGGNPIRYQYMNVIDALFNLPVVQAHSEARDIKYGFAIFFTKLCYAEDNVFSNDGGLINNGSRFLQKLNTLIDNNPNNPIPQDVQFLYMCKAYNFIEAHIRLNKSVDFLQDSPWENNGKKFLDSMIHMLQATLYKEQDIVKSVEQARPAAEQLRLNMQNVKKRYLALSPKGAHAEDAEFIDFVYSYCMKEDQKLGYISQASDDTRYALALFYKMRLQTSYSSYARLSLGFYNEKVTNFNKIIAEDTGINLLSAHALKPEVVIPLFYILLYTLNNIKNDHAFIQEAQANGFKNACTKLDSVRKDVAAKHTELTMIQEGGLHGKVKHILKGASKFTMNMALKGGLGLLIPAALLVAPGATLGTAFAIFVNGQFVGTTAAALFLSLGLPAILSGVLHEAIEESADKAAELGTGVVLAPITITTGVINYLSSTKVKAPTGRELLSSTKWVEGFYIAPPQVYKEEKKQALENISGIKRQQRPAPPALPAPKVPSMSK